MVRPGGHSSVVQLTEVLWPKLFRGVKLFKYFGRKYKILLLFEGAAHHLGHDALVYCDFFPEAQSEDSPAGHEVMG